jgi:hypothetical protein
MAVLPAGLLLSGKAYGRAAWRSQGLSLERF